MEFKQSNIEEILESERAMVLHAPERFRAYYDNAAGFANLFAHFLKSVDPDRFIFVMFLSQIRKHHLLALFSAVRLHHVQAMMDLRQVLEAGACAAYAIANTDKDDFADYSDDGVLSLTPRLTEKRYAWLDRNFQAGSRAIKNMKKAINASAAHANIVNAHMSFNLNSAARQFETPFFDAKDDYLIKTDLWQIGNIAMGLLDLFYGVNQNLGVLKFVDDFAPRLKALEAENHRLKAEMMATDRFQRARERAGM